jgi:hypothetical protein
MRILVWFILIVVTSWLASQRARCASEREGRATKSLLESVRLRQHLTGCPLDKPGCVPPTVRAPPTDEGEVFHGRDSLFCRLVDRVSSPLGYVMAAGDQSMVLSVPLEEEGMRWFAEQCDCRWPKALPAWMTSWSYREPGKKSKLRFGELVSNVTTEEVLARAREDEPFFGVRGEQFVRWVHDSGASSSGFYNEASVRVTEARRVGVVVRNVWVWKHIVPGILSNTVLFDIAMNEVELSTWSNDGCDCAPDDRGLVWATDMAMDSIRQRVPLAVTQNAAVVTF